jgi:hypothetical protein
LTVAGLSVLLFAGGIYLIVTGTLVLGGIVVLLGLFDVALAASLRGPARHPKIGSSHPGPSSIPAGRVLLVASSFAAMGAVIGASGGVGLAVGLAIFAGAIALFVSLLMMGGSRSSKGGNSRAWNQ